MEPRSRAWNWPHAEHLAPESDLVKSQNDINDTSAAFDNNGTWTEGIESAMHWLIKDEIQFVSIFLNEPGETAEIYGPESRKVADAVKVLDDKIGKLLDRLEHAELWPDKLNLIITSTPGYTTLDPDHLIDLSTMVKADFYMAVGQSPVLNIHPLSEYRG